MSDLLTKVRSKAFGTGLHQGFAAPTIFFSNPVRHVVVFSDRDIETAWKEVGQALKSANAVERGTFGKNTGKTSKQGRRAA